MGEPQSDDHYAVYLKVRIETFGKPERHADQIAREVARALEAFGIDAIITDLRVESRSKRT